MSKKPIWSAIETTLFFYSGDMYNRASLAEFEKKNHKSWSVAVVAERTAPTATLLGWDRCTLLVLDLRSKAWIIITGDFRVIQVLEFSFILMF